MKMLLILSALWWCRVEPVSPNGDDYLHMGVSARTACKEALNSCFRKYGNMQCIVINCGVEGMDPFTSLCEEVL